MAKSDVIILQVVFLFFILIMAFVSGLLPNLLPWFKRNRLLTGIANAFSGGVFLAICLIHILPEVAEQYEEYRSSGEEEHHEEEEEHEEEGHDEHGHAHSHEFALPFALAFLGYALILLIDKVIFDTHSLVRHEHHHHGHHHGHGKTQDDKQKEPSLQDIESAKDEEEEKCNSADSVDEEYHGSRNTQFVKIIKNSLEVKKPTNEKQGAENENNPSTEQQVEEKVGEPESKSPTLSKWNLLNFTPIVLMIALSVHSFFEGAAVGLGDETSEIWPLVVAIALHKWAAAMALGVSISQNFEKNMTMMVILLAIFSLATPIGVAVGMLISDTSELTEVIFNSLAAGTFLYITCSEVIIEEFSIQKHKYVKMAMFMIGAGAITGFSQIDF